MDSELIMVQVAQIVFVLILVLMEDGLGERCFYNLFSHNKLGGKNQPF